MSLLIQSGILAEIVTKSANHVIAVRLLPESSPIFRSLFKASIIKIISIYLNL
jgi:hypothetical protein